MRCLAVIVLAVYVCLVLHAVGNAMLQGREPAKTLAWTLVILTVPVVGLVLYYFFGQNLTHEYRRRRRLRRGSISPKIFSRFVRQGISELPPRYASLMLMEKRTCFALPYEMRDAEFFTAGADFFDSLVGDIARARHHVHLQFFIFADDETGNRLLSAMKEAAGRGVTVRLIYDHVGSWSTSGRFFRRMQRAGIQVQAYEPVHFRRLTHRVNYRNHRKLCIIDGRVGYVGGMNVADRYVHGDGRGGVWRDLMLRCEGTAVYGIQQVFLHDWYCCSREFLASPPYYPILTGVKGDGSGGVPVQMVSSEPFGRCHNIMMAYSFLFHNARERILIQTPYFMPTQSVLESLQAAAQRGVHVQVMVPARMRSRWMQSAVESYYGDVLEAGVEVYTYQPGFLHAKTVVIDDDFCAVGSVNMDYRSLLGTFEDCLFVYDTGISGILREDFLRARRDCRRVEPAIWRKRSLRRRVAEAFFRLFSPLM